MMKKLFFLSLSIFSGYQNVSAWSLGGLWQKTEKETTSKEYQVSSTCTITVHNTEGSITIKPWPQNKILIEAMKKGSVDEQKNTSISAKALGSEATIITRVAPNQKSSKVDYNLMVPEDATIKITQTNGSVKMRGIHGIVDIAIVEQGSIEVIDSNKTISATTNNGDIKVQQNKFEEPHAIFLKSDRGNITLLMPRETRATLHAKTVAGAITSNHPVTLAPLTLKLNKESWDRIKKEVDGTLGGLEGGAPITIEAIKGNITINEA